VKFQDRHIVQLSRAKARVIGLCLFLVVMSAGVQALHIHPADLVNDTKHCSVCQVAHSAIQVPALSALCFSFHATDFLPAAADSDSYNNPASFALFSRPPPLV